MDIARLVLQFLAVLIWPALLLIFGFWFRDTIRRLLERILLEGKQIDVEIAGQKLSVVLAKEVVKEAITTVVNDPKLSESPKEIEQIASDSAMVLSVLPKLSNTDTELLCQISKRPRESELDNSSALAAMKKLRSMGLIDGAGESAELTDLGKRIVSLVAGRDVDEALHRIGQSL